MGNILIQTIPPKQYCWRPNVQTLKLARDSSHSSHSMCSVSGPGLAVETVVPKEAAGHGPVPCCHLQPEVITETITQMKLGFSIAPSRGLSG